MSGVARVRCALVCTVTVVAIAAGVGGARPARAQPSAPTSTATTTQAATTATPTTTEGPKPEPTYHPAPDAPLADDAHKRPRPDYGEDSPPPSVGEALLWVPRVLFSPVYLVTEFVIRRPVGFLVTEIEKIRAWEVVIDFFTFDHRRIGIVPTFFVQFDLRSSAGLYVFWNDFGFEGNDIRSNFAFGGEQWWLFSLRDRLRFGDVNEAELGFYYRQRPDQVFAGTGSDVDVEDSSRFLQRTIEGRASFRRRIWRQSELMWSARIGQHRFDGSVAGFGDPALDDALRLGFFEAPSALSSGYTVLGQELRAVVDSRPTGLRSHGTGVRAEAYFDVALDLEAPSRRRWLTFGGLVGGFVDVGSNHVVGSTLRVESQAAADGEIPFTELVQPDRSPFEMAAFTPGVLRGPSLMVATLEYRYPIWVLIDGSVHVSAGNVFDEALSDFAWNRLRMSFGLGLRSSDRDNPVTVVLAFGTQTFEKGAAVESARVAFGVGF